MNDESSWHRYMETCRQTRGTGMMEVTFRLPRDYRPMRTESMWAKQVGPELFVLQNSPFHAEGVSYLDTVRARCREGEWFFAGVHARSGHSTFRVFLADGWLGRPWREAYAPLAQFGCVIERADGKWAAVDVPPAADILAVEAALRRGEREGRWVWEEGHFGHPRA